MAAEISSLKKRRVPGFMTLLSSAACEWFLIFLLFIYAAMSYILITFAHYCELKTPCLLCSRLDHVFGKKKPAWYWSLLCNSHREEISSSVSCSVHSKIANVHGMCEECLTPIAMENKSNSETYKLLVGKLWVDIERSVLQHLMLNKQIRLGSSGRRTCSCCNKTWRVKPNNERLLEFTQVGFGASKANVKPPLPRVPGRSRFSRRDSLKRLRDKFTGPISPHSSSPSSSVDTLSHVGYTKLKISSDTESEMLFSEDEDDGNASSRGKNVGKAEKDVRFGWKGVNKTQVDDNVAVNKKINQDFEVKPVNIDQPNLVDLSEHKNVNPLSSESFIEHGLRELNWAESYHKPTELISLEDGPQTPDVGGDSSPKETYNSSVSLLPHMSALSVLSELLSLSSGPLSNNIETISKKAIDVEGTSETEVISETKLKEAASVDDSCSSESKNVNPTNASTKSSEDKKPLGIQTVEQIKVCDSVKPKEVTTSELGFSSKDTSPRAHEKHDKSRKDEESSSQTHPISDTNVRNDSSYESLDENSVSDIEGESIIDRLKRQVNHDQSCMNSLYKELEEERNAAAIAANEAMAMITRLQEEKAALHMEALQYLRMMEEQAEYDMEALERANDILAEKEKELQDLETELEFYRNNFLDESGVPDTQKETSTKNLKSNGNSKSINSSISNFEDEKLYILQCLKKLEEKLHQSPSNGLNSENNKSNENPSQKIESNGTTSDHDKENGCLHGKSDELSVSRGVIEKEIEQLHDRLEALETDRDFLNHASDLLQNGNDGLNLIQEISHQLQELRNMEFTKR
ncbi:hypothetical protein ACJIZ3_011824 [Penstemon smallii]|uniref:GTD-binding domain-containing protein n=1 Tax=Penstemon smallii TaxID=265156 RepID=A0ABD3ULG7_9LAMI